ncbi:MAG: hypothetical protein AAB575_04870 [Patescibacteria group bacterium]
MKKVTSVLILVLCAVLGVVAGCGDTTVDGPVPIEGTIGTEPAGPQVTYNKDTCNDNADCGSDELCTVDPAATKAVGYTIQVCVKGCDAELETIDTDVKSEDGTSFTAKETVKVDGTDTCQRLGDETVYCDLAVHECAKYETTEPTPDPTKPTPEPTEPTPTEETSFALVRCCYDGDTSGLYGQFAWSTSTAAAPEKWEAARDLEFDWKGCFSTSVDLAKVTIGFWVDATVGPHDGVPADEVVWKGSSLKPASCYVGGESTEVGSFEDNFGWPLYDAASD